MSCLSCFVVVFLAVALLHLSGCSAAIEPFPLTEVRLLNTSIQSRYERLNQKYLLDMLDPDSLLWSFRKVRHCVQRRCVSPGRAPLRRPATPSAPFLADSRPAHTGQAVRGLVGGEEHVCGAGNSLGVPDVGLPMTARASHAPLVAGPQLRAAWTFCGPRPVRPIACVGSNRCADAQHADAQAASACPHVRLGHCLASFTCAPVLHRPCPCTTLASMCHICGSVHRRQSPIVAMSPVSATREPSLPY